MRTKENYQTNIYRKTQILEKKSGKDKEANKGIRNFQQHIKQNTTKKEQRKDTSNGELTKS